MLLAFDIGNTNIKAGLFDGDELISVKVFSPADNLFPELSAFEINRVAVSSVVPGLTFKITEIIKERLNLPAFIISAKSRFGVKINYDNPETLGIDRICSAEGAFSIFKKSNDFNTFDSKTFLVAIDFGTATTINIVGFPGIFMGGIIAPGIKTMMSSLKSNTAQLPEIDFESYKGFIGRDTKSSIASGIINSTTGLIEKILSFMKTELNSEKTHIFVTGGNAETIFPHLNFQYHYEKGLVLKGIKSVYDLNN